MFYGMPIHIIRDVALTIRSFYKRITDFVRYRQATRDMNQRYPDATAEEVAREDVCIICREDMRPWQQQPNATAAQQPENSGAAPTAPPVVDERLRPKKLSCGHILHFACLRSWLERQQNCPTCRRPVLVTGTVARVQEQNMANQHERAQPQNNQAHVQLPPHGNLHQPPVAQNVFNLGPLRIAFGARQGVHGLPQQNNNNLNVPNQQGPLAAGGQIPRVGNAFDFQRQAAGAQTRTIANFSPNNLQIQLAQIEQQLIREINGLRVQQNQLYLVRALQGELARLRIAQANPDAVLNGTMLSSNQPRMMDTPPPIAQAGNAFGANAQQQSLGSGHSSLPPGMTLPHGWTVLPLQRLPDESSASANGMDQASNSTDQLTTTDIALPTWSTSTNPQISAAAAADNSSSHPRPTPHEPNGLAKSAPGLVDSPAQSSTSTSNPNELSTTESPAQQPNGRAGSSSDQAQLEIPRWGSASGGQAGGDTGRKAQLGRMSNYETTRDDGDEQTEAVADSKQIKGKGRAPTVEESYEDVD